MLLREEHNGCQAISSLGLVSLSALMLICFTVTIFVISSSQTMLEGVYGCFMTCNVFLAGNSEVSLELQCFTAELITHIVCECDAPECLCVSVSDSTVCVNVCQCVAPLAAVFQYTVCQCVTVCVRVSVWFIVCQ